MESYKVFQLLNVTKFCFVFPLRTGIKAHAFVNCVVSVIIINHLSTNIIEQHQCIGCESITDILRCSERGEISKKIYVLLKNKKTDFLQNYVTKNIILSQACLAFISALLIWFQEKPFLTLLWAGCKVLVGATELNYLPLWSSELASITFKTSINPAWFVTTSLLCNVYAVLVALGYYSEQVKNNDPHELSTKNRDSSVEEIPLPPVAVNF